MSRLIPTWLRRWCRAFEWSTFARRWSLTMLLAASLQGGMVALAIWGLARSEQDQARQVELALAQTHPGIVQGLRDVAVDAVRLTYASTYDPDRDRAGQRLHTVTGTGAQELAALRKWVREQPGTAARELRMIDGLSSSLQRVMTDAEEVLLATTPAGRTARQAALWHSVSGYQAQLDDWVRHAQQGDGQHHVNQILAEPTSEMYLALLAGSTVCLMLTLSYVRRPEETVATEDAKVAGEEISLLRDVVENGPVPTHTVDRFGTILWANKAELTLLGYQPEEYIGHSVTEFYADPDVLDDVIQRLMHGETLVARAVRLRAKDGSIKHLLVDSSACFLQGQLHHTRCFSRDVTGLSRLEDAYRTSERRWRTLVGHSPVGIYLANPQGECTYVNERWSELAGMSTTLAAGQGWAGALHPDDRDRVFREWQAAADRQHDFTGEYRFQRPDGEIIWLSGHAVPLRDDQGRIAEYLGTITDITPLKAAQQSTTDRELKLKAIVDTATDGIVVITPRGIIESVNPAVSRLFGYQPEELVGGPVTTLMAAPYRDEHDGYLQRYLRTREPRIIGSTREVRCVHKNGTEFPVEISINVLSLADGLRFTGIIHDLTARQQAENAMLESENRFRNMANNAPVMIWKCGPDGARTFFNKRWLDFRGRPMEAELGDGWMTGLHPEDRGAVLDLYRQALTTHSARSIEYRLLRHDGEYRWMLGNLAPRIQPDGAFVGLIGTCIDITEQQLVRDQLQRSEERLALAIHGSNHIVWDVNLVTQDAFCSEQLGGLLGYEPRELPSSAPDLAALLPDEDRAAATTLFHQHLAGDAEYDLEHRARHRDGGHRWFRSRGSVMRDPTGQPIRFAGISIDITEAREQQEALRRYAADLETSKHRIEQQAAELQVASEQAAASSRTKSEFLANMSHEIRTPLNSVLGLTQLVLDSELSSDQRQLLKTVHDSGEHLLTIINDILDFSKMEAHKLQLDPIVFRLDDCLEQSLAMLRQRAVEGGLSLDRQAAAGLPDWVTGDDGRLRQILLNLLGNALKFTPRGGKVALIVRHGETAGELLFSVRDTGVGIPPERLSQIFVPFEQVDGSITRKYGGTGLGLSIVGRLVQMMRGRIWVESEVGVGSTFHFTVQLPAAEAPPAPADHEDHEVSLPALSVLVVDDAHANRLLAERMLEGQGHTVTLAEDGLIAIRQVTEQPFDLILMDMQMPNLGGLEATRRIRELESQLNRPRTPIIALTANVLADDRQACLDAGMDDLVTKPIHRPTLLNVMAKHWRQRDPDRPELAARFADILDRVDGDWELLVELIESFRVDAPKVLGHITTAANFSQIAGVSDWSHRLRGSVSIFGDSPLVAELQQIEELTRRGLEIPHDRIRQLPESIDRLFGELDLLLRQAPAAATTAS